MLEKHTWVQLHSTGKHAETLNRHVLNVKLTLEQENTLGKRL